MIRPLIVAALVALPSAAFAQTGVPSPAPSATPVPDICSSGLSAVVGRPTQTTSACVVKPGQTLIESGYQSQSVNVTGGGSFNFSSLPNAAIRIGSKSPGFEVQVLPPSWISSAGASATSDVGFGAKLQLTSTPTFADGVSALVTLPTGSNPLTNPNGFGSANAPTYVFNADAQGAFSSVFGYSGGVSVQFLNAPGATGNTPYTSVIPSFGVSWTLPASWTLVGEVWHQTNGEGPGTPGHTWFDAALEKDAGNAQFDVNYGISNRISPAPGSPAIQRRYVGIGISYLFP